MAITMTCDNCALNMRNYCKKKVKKSCNNWIDYRATCIWCKYASSCLLLGKKTGNLYVCQEFIRSEIRTDRKNFPDYDEWAKLESKKVVDSVDTSKRDNSKYKVENINTKSVHSPKKKVIVPEILVPKYAKETPESKAIWSPVEMVENIISKDFDPKVFELIDDRDLPKTTNIIEFLTEPNFMGINLFPRQLQVALDLFSAYCPYCSDTKYIRNKIEVDTPLFEIRDRYILYNNGVCPKCGKTKNNALADGLHNNYTTLAGLAGQRCVIGDTLVITEKGIVPIWYLYEEEKDGCTTRIHNSYKLVLPEGIFKVKEETIYNIYTDSGFNISGTKDHPIMTDQGFVTLSNINIGRFVPIQYNQQVYGEVEYGWEQIYEIVKELHSTGLIDPICLYNTNKKTQEMFLFMLFCLDGSVRLSYEPIVNGLKNEFYVDFSARNIHIANFFSLMMLNMGFIPLIDVASGINPYYSVMISGSKNLAILGNIIKCNINNKYVSDMQLEYKCTNKLDVFVDIFDDLPENGFSYLEYFPSGITIKFMDCIREICNGIPKTKDAYLEFSSFLSKTMVTKRHVDLINSVILKHRNIIPYSIINKWGILFSFYCKKDTFWSTIIEIGKTDPEVTYDYTIPDGHQFITNGLLSHNSGKSMFTVAIMAALTHEFLQLPSPAKFFNQLANVTFHCTFVGLRYDDAYDNLWQPFYTSIQSSPWFIQYHEFLTQEGIRLGQELFKFKDTFLLYPYKSITAYPSGPDKRKLRGRTRYGYGLDEIGWFSGGEGNMKHDADEIYTALENSNLTLKVASNALRLKHPGVPNPLGCNISSPSSKLDKITRLVKQAKVIKSIYAFHYATWEINPNIPRESLDDEFLKNYEVAERDFGANPPFGVSPFIASPSHLVPLLTKRKNRLKLFRYGTTQDSLGKKLLYPVISCVPNNVPSILAMDMGYNNNSFALAIMNLIQNPETEVENWKVRVSGLLEIKPHNGMGLSFPMIYEKVVKVILNNFDIRMTSFDRWQSINMRQQIYKDYEIDSLQFSVNMANFEDLRSKIYSEELLLPRLEDDLDELLTMEKDFETLTFNKPVNHLFLQCLTSKDTGRIITKGDTEDATDDILRTIALGYSVMTSEEYQEFFMGDDDEEERVSGGVLGSWAGVSTDSGTGSIGMSNKLGCVTSIG